MKNIMIWKRVLYISRENSEIHCLFIVYWGWVIDVCRILVLQLRVDSAFSSNSSPLRPTISLDDIGWYWWSLALKASISTRADVVRLVDWTDSGAVERGGGLAPGEKSRWSASSSPPTFLLLPPLWLLLRPGIIPTQHSWNTPCRGTSSSLIHSASTTPPHDDTEGCILPQQG